MVDSIAAPHVWGGLSALSLGGFALAMANSAMATGKITLQYSKVSRAAQTFTFWAAAGLVSIAGVVVIIAGVWLMFFKT